MLISLAGLKAQITITQADMPVVNDTIRISVATPLANSLNFNQTGANTNWDFSTLQAGSQEVVRYVSSLSTPYGFYFLNTYGNKIADSLGGFGAFSFKNVYNFYRRTAQKFTAEGLGVSVMGFLLQQITLIPMSNTLSRSHTTILTAPHSLFHSTSLPLGLLKVKVIGSTGWMAGEISPRLMALIPAFA